MRTYREIQYFNPLFYICIGAVSISLMSLVLVHLSLGEPLTASVMLASVSFGLMLLVLLFGRMKVAVDPTELTVSFGWLGVIRRSFLIDRIGGARVCLFHPVRSYLGWGWRYGMDGSICYTTRGQRGVEIQCKGRRHIIGSRDPLQLKRAILCEPESTDERPEYQKEGLVAPQRSRPRHVSCSPSWSLIHPRDVRKKRKLV